MNPEEMRKLLKLREHRRRLESLQFAEAGKEHAAAARHAEAKARESQTCLRQAIAGQQLLYSGALGRELRSDDIDMLHYRADVLKSDANRAAAGAEKARQAFNTAALNLEQARQRLAQSAYRVFKTEKWNARVTTEAGRRSDVREELDLGDAGAPQNQSKKAAI